MSAVTWVQVDAAVADMRSGIAAWRLSRLLAWQDIKQRYRRSTLGPIWLTLSSGVQMLTMSMLTSFLFNAPIQKSVPFVCAGMLFWGLITQMINEGATLFVSTSSYITQIKRPFTIFVVQVIWRNAIVAAHNAVIYILVAVIFVVIPSSSIFLWPFGFILDMICMSWMVLICAIVSARYRDIPVDHTEHSQYCFLAYATDVFPRTTWFEAIHSGLQPYHAYDCAVARAASRRSADAERLAGCTDPCSRWLGRHVFVFCPLSCPHCVLAVGPDVIDQRREFTRRVSDL